MKKRKMNKYISSGLLLISTVLFLEHLIDLPEIIQGFGLGLGICLELIGAFTSKYDMTKLKEFKKRILKSLTG